MNIAPQIKGSHKRKSLAASAHKILIDFSVAGMNRPTIEPFQVPKSAKQAPVAFRLSYQEAALILMIAANAISLSLSD